MGRMLFTCLLTIALVEYAAAAQVLRMAPGESISVRVSRHDLTRIAIADGRIAKVWGQAARVEVEADADGGQVFIQPAAGFDQEFSLYLRDDLGDTYALLITPEQRMAETLLIRRYVEQEQKKSQPLSVPYVQRIKHRMKLLLTDSRPEGTVIDDSRYERDWRPGIIMSRLSRSMADGWYSERYRLQNKSSTLLLLSEQDFADFDDGILAVQIKQMEVPVGGTTTVYLLRGEGAVR